MQVSVENVGTLGRRLNITVPADQLEKAYADRLQRLSRQVRVPGFRQGKVPLKMVEAQYGAQLLEEVAGDVIQSSFREAIGREGLRPAGGPRIQPKSLKRGEEFAYTAEFEIFPEIKRPTLAGVRIERPRATVGDEDVNRTLETIRKQRTRFDAVERAAQSGDRVTIDFTGRLNGTPFEGGSARNFPVVLGGHALLDDLENGLVGIARGETRSIAVHFPDSYRNPKLAGQNAEFEVRANEVAAPVVPEVSEALARELGVASGNVDELRVQVRENLEREAAKRSDAAVRTRVMQALLDANRFEVPKALLDEEVAQMKTRGGAPSGASDDDIRARARIRVTLALILGEVMRHQGIVADPARVRARLEELAAEYESPEEFIQWHYEQPGRLTTIESLVAEEKVVEELLKTAELTDKPLSFQDMLNFNETLH
jgi:trigger factor